MGDRCRGDFYVLYGNNFFFIIWELTKNHRGFVTLLLDSPRSQTLGVDSSISFLSVIEPDVSYRPKRDFTDFHGHVVAISKMMSNSRSSHPPFSERSNKQNKIGLMGLLRRCMVEPLDPIQVVPLQYYISDIIIL